jgi:hypothetical protein
MERLSFDSSIRELAGLDVWLTSLGIDVKKDRWHAAALMLCRAKEQRRQLDLGAPFQPIPNYVAGLFEVLEVLKVFRAFNDPCWTVTRAISEDGAHLRRAFINRIFARGWVG